MKAMCPLCPHALREHDDGEPCSAVEAETSRSDPPADRVEVIYTSRCKRRDRKDQPYPWHVWLPRDAFDAQTKATP